jgi:IS1 family transposase/transposase-like protein
MHTHDALPLLVCLLLLLGAWLYQYARSFHRPARAQESPYLHVPRCLKPCSPLDCPACCLAASAVPAQEPKRVPVRPWREVKCRGGAPKRVNTKGVACPNQACSYYGISEAHIHAIVSDGTTGKAERIQRWRCQACQTKFSARLHTPMYRLKTPSRQVALVLSALAEGLDVSAAERVFGVRQTTITRWLVRAGAHAQMLHQRTFSQMEILHVQVDEIRTRLRRHTQVLWLWVAIDPLTKCIPVFQLGPRTHDMAHLLIHRLREHLAPGCLPLFTSDGLNAYFYALTAHFGDWIKATGTRSSKPQWQVEPGLLYGQVQKQHRRRKLVRVKHMIRLGTGAAFKEALQALGFSGRVNTAFIERVNLTIRRGVAALARRTWATALQAPHLEAHLHWWLAYYHFVRPHGSLRVPIQMRANACSRRRLRYRQRTPAMAAGRMRQRWTTGQLLRCPVPPLPA